MSMKFSLKFKDERKKMERNGMQVSKKSCEYTAPACDNDDSGFIPQIKNGHPDRQQLPIKKNERCFK